MWTTWTHFFESAPRHLPSVKFLLEHHPGTSGAGSIKQPVWDLPEPPLSGWGLRNPSAWDAFFCSLVMVLFFQKAKASDRSLGLPRQASPCCPSRCGGGHKGEEGWSGAGRAGQEKGLGNDCCVSAAVPVCAGCVGRDSGGLDIQQ